MSVSPSEQPENPNEPTDAQRLEAAYEALRILGRQIRTIRGDA